jgi:hypothetical protein
MSRPLTAALLPLLLALPAAAHEPEPVGDVSWPALRDDVRTLLRGLLAADAPLPETTLRAVRDLLDREPADPDAAGRELQRLLDERCLVLVHSNPESRVKAARGPLAADLVRDRPTLVLVKVHNEGGVTSALTITGPQILVRDAEPGRWLRVEPLTTQLPRTLSGRRVQYVAFRLTPIEAGKREATLQFDVGQGTQDLGFRAEVPILFTVRPR